MFVENVLELNIKQYLRFLRQYFKNNIYFFHKMVIKFKNKNFNVTRAKIFYFVNNARKLLIFTIM